MRIRRRLVLYAIGVATLGMVLFAALLLALASRGVVNDQAVSLADLAADTAASLELTDAAIDGPRPPLVADLRTSVDPFIVVTAVDGTVRFSSGELDGAAPAVPAAVVVEALERGTSAATVRLAPDLEVVLAAADYDPSDGAPPGVVVAGQSAAFTRQQVDGLTFILVLSGIITVTAVAIVSWLVIGRALRPLRALTSTVDEIRTTGDLTRRLPPVRVRDEVGTLTTSFNAMLDEVAASQERQAAALAAQRRFVADASHELRTPLTTIRTNAEFLAEHPGLEPDDRQEAVDDIAAEAERMARLVDGLLALARSDAGSVLALRPVDLASLADEVGQRAARAEPTHEVIVTTTGAAIVAGDADLLTRLLWILVDNALRHGSGRVELAVGGSGDEVTLTVSDRGPGIPPADRGRVFERFAKVDATRSAGGFGLGLAIGRSIVEAHGGTIAIEDRDGGGATVRVVLPTAP